MSDGPRCPLCGGAAPKSFVRERGSYRLYDCAECGAGFCDPFRNPGPEYYEHKTGTYPARVEETTDPASEEYDEALKVLARALPRGARLLDVGCGAGGFLHRARAAGLSVAGVDFNAVRSGLLRGRGFDVFTGSLPDFARARGGERFAAVTMFEIVEHLDNPAEWLAAARGLLEKGGLLIVGTPNRDRRFDPFQGPGQGDIDLPPHHLTRWSAAALTRFLERSGFAVRECRALSYPLAMFSLLLRDNLRLGLATRALDVEQLPSVPAEGPSAPPGPRERAVRALVAVKSAAINALAAVSFPFFRLACRLFGWEGVILLAVAAPKRDG